MEILLYAGIHILVVLLLMFILKTSKNKTVLEISAFIFVLIYPRVLWRTHNHKKPND